MDGSLAQLLAYWADRGEARDRRELVNLILETVRDDLLQAQTKDGREVVDPRNMQVYLSEQIAELRRLWTPANENAAD